MSHRHEQGITPTDLGVVDEFTESVGGDLTHIYYHFNDETDEWEAYLLDVQISPLSIRNHAGDWEL